MEDNLELMNTYACSYQQNGSNPPVPMWRIKLSEYPDMMMTMKTYMMMTDTKADAFLQKVPNMSHSLYHTVVLLKSDSVSKRFHQQLVSLGVFSRLPKVQIVIDTTEKIPNLRYVHKDVVFSGEKKK